ALVSVVGGDLVEVETIVPPATDPEAFEPRPSDLDRIRHASLLVRVGLGYDFWLDALINQVGDMRLMRGGEGYLDASTGLPLLEIRGQSVVNEGGHAHGVANPHYWLDPANAVIVTAGIAEALFRVAPADRKGFSGKRDLFRADRAARRQRGSAMLAPSGGVKFIASHTPGLSFARRFRLDVIDFIEPKPGVA